MEVTLVRHGESESNAGLTDFLDSPLTPLGEQQADLTAERLRGDGLTRVYVSPLRRALQTIAPICAATGLGAEVYSEVCEYFSSDPFLQFPGLSPEAIRAEFPFTFLSKTSPCEPVWWPQQLENDQMIYARAERVRDALLGLYGQTEERIVIVSHAETVGRLIEAFLHLPPRPADPPWSDNCGISRVRFSHDSTQPGQLLIQNDTSHLESLRYDEA